MVISAPALVIDSDWVVGVAWLVARMATTNTLWQHSLTHQNFLIERVPPQVTIVQTTEMKTVTDLDRDTIVGQPVGRER